ncbi:hypothetical protein BEWA_013230 [Theileria equi strain WA]|uniref:Signal peptide containing protein n=1 Tax=Theileria equi strain WA TaxID=1537102 RepID=L1LBX1_THEEQ|nr:hypothetical protein BEWA_013230 [Theileria equi strain WA]EKX72764.1 hypothetical protein BEWA_013230 [Theileria equi strain WA]|eukprot:XP_004832216.1 hypothetical protein BEWA_013230 [Theileria equi strain WA]
MRILTLFYTLCLAGLCYCGDENKVYTSLFNVDEAKEDCIKVLKLTAKVDKVAELKYDQDIIWSSGIFGSPCSSAVLYMDKGRPTLAVIKTKGFLGKEGTTYKYYDGKQWKDGREGTHKNKLKKLKEKCKSENILDITNPDKSKIDVKTKNDDGIECREYHLKSSSKITSVLDSGVTIWTATSEEMCTLAVSFTRGNSSSLVILINDGQNIQNRFFKKADGRWEDATDKVKKMEESETPPPNETADSSTSSLQLENKDSEQSLDTSILEETVEGSTDDHLNVPPKASHEEPENLPEVLVEDVPEVIVEDVSEVPEHSEDTDLVSKDTKTEGNNNDSTDQNGDLLSALDTTDSDSLASENVYCEEAEGVNEVEESESEEPKEDAAKESPEEAPIEVTLNGILQEDKTEPADKPVKSPAHETSEEASFMPIEQSPQEVDPQVGHVDVILDLANPDKDKVEISKREVYGVEHTAYTPKDAVLITLVVDGETKLLATPEGEELLLAIVSTKGDSSLLLISPKTGNKHFEKDGLVLDLANQSETEIVVEYRISGVAVKNYSPKNGHHIDLILEDGVLIWVSYGKVKSTLHSLDNNDLSKYLKGDDGSQDILEDINHGDSENLSIFPHLFGTITMLHSIGLDPHGNMENFPKLPVSDSNEKCIGVKSYTKGESMLLVMTIRNDYGHTDHYFEKVDIEWNEIDEELFNAKLKIMINGHGNNPN